MNMDEITAKAEVLLEALPYIQRFRGSTFVVKYGGSFMDDPDPSVRSRVAYDIAFFAACGINTVVVHGGGKAITRAMTKSGLQAKFINGMRVTDAETVKIVRSTLNEVVNPDVCTAIKEAKGKPHGLPGDEVLRCRKLEQSDEGDPIDLGYVGEVTEVKVKLIKKAIAEGLIPVISPMALDHDGHPYNVNADMAAGRVASALRARRLVYMSDVPGLLSDPDDLDSLISTLKISQVEGLKETGVISKGMRPKVGGGMRALQDGVHRVHFIDGRMPHSILLEIFTDQGIGTEIVHA